MKEQLHNVLQNIQRRQPKTLIIITVSLLLVIATTAVYSSMNKGDVVADTMSSDTSTSEDASIVATFGVNGTSTESLVSNNSWPGELVSADISQIQPQRAGIITDWRVHIGEYVSQGEVLGKISAPPATPELIKMLAEQTEAVTKARAQVTISDEFATKEQARLNALKSSLENGSATGSDLTFTSLTRLREKVDVKKKAMRAFVEQAVSTHVTTLSNATTWKSFSNSSTVNGQYGALDQSTQYAYKVALSSLIEKLKTSQDVPIEDAQNYFALAVKLANNSNDESTSAFKTVTANDQNGFSTVLSDYKDAQAMLADKETEYKLTISEQSSSVEKDRSMAYAEAKASEAAYSTVAGQITGGLAITSPRSGTVSAIYKKVGDLVGPEMAIAVIAGKDNSKLTVRIRIPSNTNRPVSGDMVSVIRPGYTKDVKQAKILGVGTTLDETGSYLADAILQDNVDWPVGSSVRVVPVKSSNTPSIKTSSMWWSEGGIPHVWAVSDAGRIFAKKITIGRTLGDSIEVTDGLKSSEKYITDGTLDITENMSIDDLVKQVAPPETTTSSSEKSGKKKDDMANMPGM
jgi:multidrug resistance efflux pump